MITIIKEYESSRNKETGGHQEKRLKQGKKNEKRKQQLNDKYITLCSFSPATANSQQNFL